jgi:two-component system KDP operon response regulator KdpE
MGPSNGQVHPAVNWPRASTAHHPALRHSGKVLTHRQLLHDVWGPSHIEHSHYLRIYLGHLRQKLADDPARPRHLITETGIGDRFAPS